MSGIALKSDDDIYIFLMKECYKKMQKSLMRRIIEKIKFKQDFLRRLLPVDSHTCTER